MNAIVYFFGSGTAFFVGVMTLLVAATLPQRPRCVRSVAGAAMLIGLALVGLSAAPLPEPFYLIAGFASGLRLAATWSGRATAGRSRVWLNGLVGVTWLVGLGMEAPHHLVPEPGRVETRRLTVIGDSLSAGTGERGVVPWPRRLAERQSLALDDRSRVGATAGSALRSATSPPPGEGIVLLEIGGNDLLGGTDADEFGRNLDSLLGSVTGPGRLVVMLELPLPPLANEFGRVQRRLSDQYGVTLVPKRVLTGVITADGATSDGVHLTDAGHDRMANAVWEMIHPAYEHP